MVLFILLIIVMTVVGCTGGGSGGRSYSISGIVKDEAGRGLPGVTMTLTGPTTSQATSNAEGKWEAAAKGNVSIRPYLAGYSFNPSVAQVSNGDTQVNFTAIKNPHTISGRIVDETGRALPGVQLNCSGAYTGTLYTDADGNFQLTLKGTVTLTPEKEGYIFEPTMREADGAAANLNFIATGIEVDRTYRIGGQIKDESGMNIADVCITIRDDEGEKQVYTDLEGWWTEDIQGAATVTPAKTDYLFSPESLSVTESQPVADFIAAWLGYQVSGFVYDDLNTPLPDVDLEIDYGHEKETICTDHNGFWETRLKNPATIRPIYHGSTFEPESIYVAEAQANQVFICLLATKDYLVSGRVLDESGQGVAGITIKFTLGETVITDESGCWQALLRGMVTISPQLPDGFRFIPDHVNVTGETGEEVIFTLYPLYLAEGRITDEAGCGVAGISISINGEFDNIVTDSDGKWKASGIYGECIIQPHHDDYIFSPESWTITKYSNQVDFSASKLLSITGHIVDIERGGLAGVAITVTGDLSQELSTDEYGRFRTNLFQGEATLVPSLDDYIFQPESCTAQAGTESIEFVGIKTYDIGGQITDEFGQVMEGVILEISGEHVGTLQVTTDAQGRWSAKVKGKILIVPQVFDDYIFKPGSRSNITSGTMDLDFGAEISIPSYIIRGQIKYDDHKEGIPNIEIAGAGTATTTFGYWNALVKRDTEVIIRPVSDEFRFEPEYRKFTVEEALQGLDFIGYSTVFAGGGGYNTNPYVVATPEQLDSVRNYPASRFIQAADIHLSGYGNWEPIGDLNHPFTGVYNGKDYRIYSLTIDRANQDQIGLFGLIEDAEISNVELRRVSINGGDDTGSLVGRAINSTITRCIVTDDRTIPQTYIRGNNNVGGIAGQITKTTLISRSSAHGPVEGNMYVGGLVGGSTPQARIVRSFATEDVEGKDYVGGLIGFLSGTSLDYQENYTVYRCYASGDVKATGAGGSAGGLVGQMSTKGAISDCFASGAVRSQSNAGGITGYIDISQPHFYNYYFTRNYFCGTLSGRSTGSVIGNANPSGLGLSILYCYFDSDVLGISPTYVQSLGLTTQAMKQKAFYNGWDFDQIWIITGDGYPRLRDLDR